jgi:deoxyribonuclease V
MFIKWQRHPWDVFPAEAKRIQMALAQEVSHVDAPGFQLRTVAGVDCAPSSRKGYIRAAVVILSFPALELIEHHWCDVPRSWPYIPGFLSFREVPCLLEVLALVHHTPDIILVDGMGIAHPRRLGVASHLGLWLNVPTIGCGKTLLIGTHDEPPSMAPAQVPLWDKDEQIGAVVRTRSYINPLFVSVGTGISLPTATHVVLSCVRSYRLPEPIRLADQLSKGTTILNAPFYARL